MASVIWCLSFCNLQIGHQPDRGRADRRISRGESYFLIRDRVPDFLAFPPSYTRAVTPSHNQSHLVCGSARTLIHTWLFRGWFPDSNQVVTSRCHSGIQILCRKLFSGFSYPLASPINTRLLKSTSGTTSKRTISESRHLVGYIAAWVGSWKKLGVA